ncbi:Polynucleotide 5'-hydroxyl-kinase grc3 [Mortierella sp. GBA30]|nr:Polynucleotide 5'-hydroxyl-kinase grc3 [Mortierella sp. GBA30]
MPRHRSLLLALIVIASLTYFFLTWRRSPASDLPKAAHQQQKSINDTDTYHAVTGRQRPEYRRLDLDLIHQYLPTKDAEKSAPTDHILIATPLMDAVPYLGTYFNNLANINYPKELISLGFLVSTTTYDSSEDPTLLSLSSHLSKLLAKSSYRRITVIQQKSAPSNYTHKQRHEYDLQTSRRKTLARCRNALLTSELLDEAWVLWLDVDVTEYSSELLHRMMGYNKDIVAPNCFRSENNWFRTRNIPYDRNNWIETTESLANQRVLEDDEILFEGYEQDHPTYRKSMADLGQDSPSLVALDGIGGTFTLIKASVHRAGVIFPATPIDHEIETEGLAKWAKREGFAVFVGSATTTTATASLTPSTAGSTPAPLSALAARRQKLLVGDSKASTPEVEEHAQVDNLDVDEEEKASLNSDVSDNDQSDSESSDHDDEGAETMSTTKSPSTPQYERRDRKLYLDPQSVSSFKPTRYNVAYSVISGNLTMMLIGMRRGETLVFQGCATIIPLIGHSAAFGYIMSGTAEKRRPGSKKNGTRSGPSELDLSSVSTFDIFSPRTHALAVIESVSLAGSQKDLMVPQRTVPTSPETKARLASLLDQLTLDDFDTVIAVQSASNCGLLGIEKVVPLFKGILSIKQNVRLRGNEDEERLAQVRFESSLSGFHPILEPTDSIAALQIPSTWRDAMQALIDSTVDENSGRVKRPPVSVVCGGKKMGKSTFSRMILNRMLNRYRKVAFIECDVGQSEFTPVGMVALHVVETPALGAPFTHPRQPYRAFFVGNSTPRDDPDYYMACIKELVKTYYAEVSHTRSWEDNDDDYHSDDDDDEHIPLVINTQGWIKGMGYDLLLQLLDYTAPSHIFGFHSPSSGESNLPQIFFATMKEQAQIAGRQQPSFSYVSAVVLGDDNNASPFTKYHPADHRALALLSYFYLKQEQGLEQGSLADVDRRTWDFTKALVVRRPWSWDWNQAKGIWVLFDQVPPSQILHVLNASLVALMGDKENRFDDDDRPGESETNGQAQPALAKDTPPADQTMPLNYFPLGQFPPPPPEHTTCHGLAIIRSIQPSTRMLHILTPIPLSKLKKCNGIVKGALHMPIHASLDHNEENSKVPGIAGVPWKNVPYLNYEISSGTYNTGSQSPSLGNQSPRLGFAPVGKIIGADAKVTRKNLGRKRLQT